MKENKQITDLVYAINRAKKLVSMKVRGVLVSSLCHSHTNDLGIILVHRATRNKYLVGKNDQVRVITAV